MGLDEYTEVYRVAIDPRNPVLVVVVVSSRKRETDRLSDAAHKSLMRICLLHRIRIKMKFGEILRRVEFASARTFILIRIALPQSEEHVRWSVELE